MVLALIMGFFMSAPVSAHGLDPLPGKKVVFNMTPTGYPPFMIPAVNDQPPGGIIFDIFQTILNRQGITVDTVAVPKKRELEFFERDKLDAHATAIEWVRNPDEFVFTDPILRVRNVIFTKAGSSFQFSGVEDLFGKHLVTHLGFVYPPLTRYFETGKIWRMDANNTLSMLHMVLLDRGDGAIMNDAVGSWLIRQYNLDGQLVASRAAVTDFGYRIMFAREWKPLVDAFNIELKAMRESGELASIFERYTYTPPDVEMLDN